MALTCCTKALLTRPDVAGSPALWAEVEVEGSGEGALAHLPSWLCRRAAAVRRLRVGSPGCPLCPRVAAGLGSLRGLVQLDVSGCGLQGLPQALGALGPTLVRLDLSFNPLGHSMLQGSSGNSAASGAATSPFAPLAQLQGLTALSLAGCALPALPAELAALGGSLRELGAAHNDFHYPGSGAGEGSGGGGAFAPLAALACLSRLDLFSCRRLRAVPAELSQLPQLADLDLGGHTVEVEEGDAEALAPLASLPSLARLCISRGTVPKRRLPPPLPALAARGVLEWHF